jgi:FkbM family methyltransferase
MIDQVFHEKLFSLMTDSLKNYHSDNFDEERYGKQDKNLVAHLKKRLLSLLLPNRVSNYYFSATIRKTSQILEVYGQKLNQVYMLLANDVSKDWLVRLIAYQILGHEKVKLPTNNPMYFSVRNSEKLYLNYDQFIEVFFLGKQKKLFLADLASMGINIKVYSAGLDHIFMHQQHRYKNIVVPEKGDVVLDCGACYGDSCLYFANLVGEEGKVFSFEFIPDHIEVFKKNLDLNPSLQRIADLVEYPLWEKKGQRVYFKYNGPGSRVEPTEFDGYECVTETQTIDDFYKERELSKVDFIKMDIEGAELYALKGGEDVIRKHKPKLAIASYHSLDDFVNIPLWINSLGLGYKIYLDHSTIHWEETVVFASAD